MESLDDLREVMTCVVCLDTLSPAAVQCERGHALCQRCRHDQRYCPSCRKPFLADKPILLSQIAAIVGGQCKFRGCTYIRQHKDDHQVWCGFRPANCKLCNWTGYGKNVYRHVQEAHQLSLVSSESENLVQKLEDCIRSRQFYIPFSALSFFFWLQLKDVSLDWQNQHNVLVIRINLVPNGKINHDLHFIVGLKSKNSVYNVREKIKILPLEDSSISNCVFIPGFNSVDGDRVLRLSVDMDGGQTIKENINFCSTYNFNQGFDTYRAFKRYLSETFGNILYITDVYKAFDRRFEEITSVKVFPFLLAIAITLLVLSFKGFPLLLTIAITLVLSFKMFPFLSAIAITLLVMSLKGFPLLLVIAITLTLILLPTKPR